MKTINKLALVTAVAVSFAAANFVQAEPLLSPRDKANQTKTVSGMSEDKLDRSIQNGTARTRELANTAKMDSSKSSTENSVGYSATCNVGVTGSPKVHDMMKDTCANFQIAPVK